MSLFGALDSAVSGLNANSNALGIISDNIANANTVGYKATTTDFSSLVTQSGVGADYSPGGVTSSPLFNVSAQGAIQSASSVTDLAISGQGFFVVNSSAAGDAGSGTTSFTRAGNFSVDAAGNLVNAAGLYLQGQILTPAESEAIAAGAAPSLSGTTVGGLQTINVNDVSSSATATSNVDLAANLPANATTAQTMTVPVYDSEGVEHDLTLTYTPAGGNAWTVTPSIANAGTTTVAINNGDDAVQFNSDGSLNAAGSTFNTADALSITWDPAVSGGTSPQNISFNLGTDAETNGLSQLGTTFSVSSITQDGVALGTFSSVSIGANGLVNANFSNGQSQAIAIIPISTFENTDGLLPESGDAYLESASSGQPLLGLAGSGAAGTIDASSLESSTVDIATEFSNLIVAQNAYSANAKVVTSVDQMTQALLGIQTT
jgi:flagellar hook protein FlgE